MSCSNIIRQPLIDLFISRQMEHQNENFANIVQDTICRLKNCSLLLNNKSNAGFELLDTNHQTTKIDEISANSKSIETSTKDDPDAAKRRAKRAQRKARKKEQNTRDENSNHDENYSNSHIVVDSYKDESQIGVIMNLIGRELSEPYSIYTYRYFINTWPALTLLAFDTIANQYVGVIVCKVDYFTDLPKNQTDEGQHVTSKGYIAMLAVNENHRGLGIGTQLVRTVIDRMQEVNCDEVILETEISNTKALNLYSRLGFIRERRLYRYYLNGSDAFRLVRSTRSN